jgi:hypothetical protein
MKKLLIGLVASTALASPSFAELLDLEKDELTFGFIKLTDMAPLAVAYEQGSSLTKACSLRSKRRRTGKCCWMA